MFKIDPLLKEIALIFKNNNRQLYLVGGAVRNMLMRVPIHDWDLATDAKPEETAAIIKPAGGKVIPTGIKHGTVTVIYKGISTEITTFRLESDYSDGRRPDTVKFTSSIEEDLSRRDFTMNSVALRLPECEIKDPFGGVKDIKAKIIRCVGNAADRFNEDGLRPVRAVRFASQLDFEIETDTLNAIPHTLEKAANVSCERIRDEIDKILMSPLPSRAFLLMERTGLLKLFLSELSLCRGIEQKGFHQFDVLDHCLHALDYTAVKNYPHEVRLAVLLHDIGKPSVRQLDESGIWKFHKHELVSGDMARNILTRLRYPNDVIHNVCRLIKEHMFFYTHDWTDAAVRRFIARVGEEHIDNLYRLRRADTYGFAAKETPSRSLIDLIEKTDKALSDSRAFKIKDLAVKGNDLINIGIKPGRKMGIILKELLETVLDDPGQNTKEKLTEIAVRLNEKHQI